MGRAAGRGPSRGRSRSERAGVAAKLRQDIDGTGWTVRIGPVESQHVAATIDAFVW